MSYHIDKTGLVYRARKVFAISPELLPDFALRFNANTRPEDDLMAQAILPYAIAVYHTSFECAQQLLGYLLYNYEKTGLEFFSFKEEVLDAFKYPGFGREKILHVSTVFWEAVKTFNE